MTILEFPNEITQRILRFLQRSDRPSLAKCLRVCKRWQNIGESILWRHVFLEIKRDNLSLSKFYNTIDDTANGLSFVVESLTLHICCDATWPPHHPKARNEDSISIAGLVLLSLPALKSLSIKCHDSSRDQLHDVLRRVSSSLESFELHYPWDLNVASQWEIPQCTPRLHICPLLSSILSKVTISKFKLPACAKILFQSSESRARSLKVRLSTSPSSERRPAIPRNVLLTKLQSSCPSCSAPRLRIFTTSRV